MKQEDRKEKSKHGFMSKISFHIVKKVLGIVIVIVFFMSLGWGIKSTFSTSNKTTKLGFEDIGELATQVAYCSEVSMTNDIRQLFGIDIPFTQSKLVYSYDVVIKAGMDFTEVKWNVDEKKKIINVEMPEVKVLSNEIDLDSFKVYHESESIFNRITLTDNNKALKALKETAQKDAIKNGLLENAQTNAETILDGFFGNEYDLEKYKIVYKVQEDKADEAREK